MLSEWARCSGDAGGVALRKLESWGGGGTGGGHPGSVCPMRASPGPQAASASHLMRHGRSVHCCTGGTPSWAAARLSDVEAGQLASSRQGLCLYDGMRVSELLVR